MPFRQPGGHLYDPFNLKQGVGARDVTRKGGDVSRVEEWSVPCSRTLSVVHVVG